MNPIPVESTTIVINNIKHINDTDKKLVLTLLFNIPDTVFYEFIEIKDIDKIDPDTYSINELKLGEKYEIVVTNQAGLYRYRLGDVIEVVGFYNHSPEIKFLYRKNQCLNMVSEKTTEDHLTIVMINTMKRLKLILVDYTTLEDNLVTPGRYIFYIEFKYKISSEMIKIIERELDKELCKVNLAYGRFRENNRLSMLKVITIKKNTFNAIKENQFKKGISKNQIKIPRVVTQNKNILKILNENISI